VARAERIPRIPKTSLYEFQEKASRVPSIAVQPAWKYRRMPTEKAVTYLSCVILMPTLPSLVESFLPNNTFVSIVSAILAVLVTVLLAAAQRRIHSRTPSVQRVERRPLAQRRLSRLKRIVTIVRVAVSRGVFLTHRRTRLVARVGLLNPSHRLKQKFGHDLAARLDGPSSVRLQAHASKFFIDGSRREQRGPFVPHRATPALDGLWTDSVEVNRESANSANGDKRTAFGDAALHDELLDPARLPSDEMPFDRLHVWLVDGTGLPHRPSWWPFEPFVLVTAVGEDTGSSAECPIGAFEFLQRAPYIHPSSPVWDEQGMLVYKRSGTTAYRVSVLGSSRLWSGLYHYRVLRPRALLLSLFAQLASWLRAPARLVVCIIERLIERASTAPAATAPSTAPATVAVDPPAADLAPLTGAVRCGGPSDGGTRSATLDCADVFPLPNAGGAWQEVRVVLDCGGEVLLRVRVSAHEARHVTEAELPPMHHHVLSGCDGRHAVLSWIRPETDLLSGADGGDVVSGMEGVAVTGSGEGTGTGAIDTGTGPDTDGDEAAAPDTTAAAANDEERKDVSFDVIRENAAPPATTAARVSAPPGSPPAAPLPPGYPIRRAVLWLPGRNEAFYHPHVSDMFDAHGWTVYVLSYRRMGVCRRLHLFGNPMHNSHSDGDFGEYHEDIRQAILLLRNHGATEILGYGHSTGATVSVMNEVIAVHRR